MLHILWMIIKFILILIGIILGLILFALLLILFCPVRDEGGRFLPHCQWAGEGKLAVWRYLIFSWVSEWTDGIGFPVIWDPCHESPEETEEP